MTTTDKSPREWWIYDIDDCEHPLLVKHKLTTQKAQTPNAYGNKMQFFDIASNMGRSYREEIHVIEHSAYLAVKQELAIQDDANDILTRQLEEKQQELDAARAEINVQDCIITNRDGELADAQDDFKEMSKNADIRIRDLENLLLEAKVQIKDYRQALDDVRRVNGMMGLGDAIIIAEDALNKWSGK